MSTNCVITRKFLLSTAQIARRPNVPASFGGDSKRSRCEARGILFDQHPWPKAQQRWSLQTVPLDKAQSNPSCVSEAIRAVYLSSLPIADVETISCQVDLSIPDILKTFASAGAAQLQ